ncbi:MAG: PepSY-associated TM helix domain-containing protein [Dermatophilaceae bacterium]
MPVVDDPTPPPSTGPGQARSSAPPPPATPSPPASSTSPPSPLTSSAPPPLPTPPTSSGDEPGRSPQRRSAGLFRAFWRWHFYASVIVIPVLLVLAVTGLIYLFRFQLEPLLHSDLLRVDPAPTVVQTYETQRLAVAQARPGDAVVSMTEPAEPDHSTRFTVETPDGEVRDVFVDPYTATVLGSLDPDTTVSGAAVRLHGDLMVGRAGDLVLELGSCWAIVMALTGYYLFVRGWRARRRSRRRGVRGAWLRSGHAHTGAAVGVSLLFLLVSGLPWTGVWGEQAQRLATSSGSSLWSEDEGALSNPTSTLDESLPHSHRAVPWAQEETPVPRSGTPDGTVAVADVDTAVAVAGGAGLGRPLTVALPGDETGVFSAVGYAFDDPGRERTVHVDQYSGQVAGSYGYDDYPVLAKVVSQSIAVHEGRRFGTLNLVLTTVFCLAIVVSCVTGPMMWWRRRPRGTGVVGAPRGRMPLAATPALAVLVVALAVLLPVFGVSLAVVLALEWLVLRRAQWSRRVFGIPTPG